MKAILWFSLAITVFAQKEIVNLSAGASVDDHPQLKELLKIRRLYVDKLAGGDTAVQIRDMLIGGLQGTRLFILTENVEKADCILKGSAEDLVFTDIFQSSEGIQGNTRSGGITRGGVGVSVGEQESTRIAERKHEATVAVRLVNKDGDVIWSTTQESFGAKFRGASADVAGKVTRQLTDDFARARKLTPAYAREPVSAAMPPP